MKNILYSNIHQQPAYNDIIKKNQRDSKLKDMFKSSPISNQNQKVSSRSSTPSKRTNLSCTGFNQQSGSKQNLKNNNNENSQDPISYYQKQTKMLKEQLKDKETQINQLKADNDHLRTLNTEYVKSINDVIHKKVENMEHIVIDKALFEGPAFKSDSKKLIQKLEQNLEKVEAQLKSFIKHCRIMEADIEVYKKKIIDADYILQGLKKTGEFSIDNLVYRLKYNDDRIQELEAGNRQLQYENCLNVEKLRNFDLKYGDIEMNYEDCKQEYQELMIKHNRLISESESRKNSDQRTIYELKCKNDIFEHELRTFQSTIESQVQEKIDSTIKETEQQIKNETLRSTFMSSKRGSAGGNGGFTVQFKQF
ncbi:hypothetical protein ABPG72_006900 [Tetrahymena utriculariae]